MGSCFSGRVSSECRLDSSLLNLIEEIPMPKQIVFTGKDECSIIEQASELLAPDSVRVRTLISLISTGTETIVLGRKFAPGTHWDDWVKYPFYPGYSVIGEVIEVGDEVTNFKSGMKVATRQSHGSEHVVATSNCYMIPGEIDLSEAAWFALAKIAFMGVKAGRVGLGSCVLIVGGGPIGQMALRWCRAAGAEQIVVVDLLGARLDLARRGGATAVIAKPIDEAIGEIENACGGSPQIVIDSTGNASVFRSAIGIASHKGTVVVLGDTGTPGEQHLTSDVITKGLTVVGAHDTHCDVEWTERRIVDLFFALLGSGRITMKGMNSHTFKPENVTEAYITVETERASTMGMLFDWTK